MNQQVIHETQEFPRCCKAYWCSDSDPARSYLANRNRSQKGRSDATHQGYQRTSLHNKLQCSWSEMPQKWCFQGAWILGEFRSPHIMFTQRPIFQPFLAQFVIRNGVLIACCAAALCSSQLRFPHYSNSGSEDDGTHGSQSEHHIG